jgi:ABC-2 type transport system permease protein
MLVSLAVGAKELYIAFDAIGQGKALISLAFAVASTVVFIFGIFYTLSTYYMAKDIPNYLSMPIRPYEIIISRFLTVVVYEYLTLGIFLLPVIIGIGLAGSFGLLYYLFSLITLLLIPMLPLSLASVIIILIMSFSRKAINKDRFTMISGLIGLVIAIGFSFGTQGFFMKVENPEELQQLILSGQYSISDKFASMFPGIRNASEAVSGNNILQLMIFIGIALLSVAVFMLVAEKLYFKGLLGMTQQAARRDFNAEEEKTFKGRSKITTYTLKELRLILRTPIYFMNLAIMDFIMPLFLVIPLVSANQLGTAVTDIQNALKSSDSTGYIIGIAFSLFVFISAMNGITATSISREGRQLYVMKYIPMSYRDQVNAKILSGMVISLLGMVLVTLIASIALSIKLWAVPLLLMAGFNGVAFTRITGMFLDVANPKLNWDNEQKAVKQNLNLVFNMIIGMAAAAGGAIMTIALKPGPLLSALIFIPGMFALNMILHNILIKSIPSMLGKIE